MLRILESAKTEAEFDSLHFAIDTARYDRALVGPFEDKLKQLRAKHHRSQRGAWRNFDKYLGELTGLPATAGNRVDFLIGGEQVVARAIPDLDRASNYIYGEVFQFQIGDEKRPDEFGRAMLERLVAKASQGVDVRLLIDAQGTDKAPFTALVRKTLAALPSELARAQARRNFRVVFDDLPLTKSRLDHRKLLVFKTEEEREGKTVAVEVAYAGGMNVGEHYQKVWYDQQTRHVGPVTEQLRGTFVKRWYEVVPSDRCGRADLVIAPTHRGLAPPAIQDPEGVKLAVIPHEGGGLDQNTKAAFLAAIRRSAHKIEFGAPYYADDDMTNELIAAKKAGVEKVKAYVPAIKLNDQKTVAAATLVHLLRLARAGVEVYEASTRMFHYKVGNFDDQTLIYGSSNADARSLIFNYELDVAALDPKLARDASQRLFGQQEGVRRLSVAQIEEQIRNNAGAVELMEKLQILL